METEATLTERFLILTDTIEIEAHPTLDTTLDSETTTIHMDHHRTTDPSLFLPLCPLLITIFLTDHTDHLLDSEATTDLESPLDTAIIMALDMIIHTDRQDTEATMDLDLED